MDLAEFVQKKNGKRVIRRVLISNNGLACVKCIRSLRKWQMQEFGQANLLKFIVMATPEDIDANAEYVRLADELIQVSGEGKFLGFFLNLLKIYTKFSKKLQVLPIITAMCL